MNGPRDALTVFTPLPPERNGIADYAALLLGALAAEYDCAAACEDWLAEAPPRDAVVPAAGAAEDVTALPALGPRTSPDSAARKVTASLVASAFFKYTT